MNLQAVFFDMGGTLQSFRYDRNWRIAHVGVLRACLEKGGIHLDWTDAQLADAITNGMSEYRRRVDSRIELTPALIWSRYVFADQRISEQTIGPIAEELSFLYETRLYERRMVPGLPAVLARIRDMGLKIGVISNTQSRGQVPANLREYGISEYFSPVILSSEYGRRKPDPAIFHQAARLARVPTSACAYVGDKLDRDIFGAQGAGFRLAIQIRHVYDDGAACARAEPDAVIDDMQELLPILERVIAEDRRAAGEATLGAIEAIFFDAGDILYHRPNKRQNLARFLAQHAANPVSDLDAHRAALTERAYCGEIARSAYYLELLKLHGIQDDAALAAGVAALEQDDETVEMMPGVPETIRALKQRGFLLGIITDTALPAHIKLDWFAKAGIGEVWDSIISSVEMGFRKPSPAIYATALDQCGVAPRRAAFVGHRTVELDGAQAVGMRTIALHADADARANFRLDRFADLLTLPLLARAGRVDTGTFGANSFRNLQVPAKPAPVDSGYQGLAAPQG